MFVMCFTFIILYLIQIKIRFRSNLPTSLKAIFIRKKRFVTVEVLLQQAPYGDFKLSFFAMIRIEKNIKPIIVGNFLKTPKEMNTIKAIPVWILVKQRCFIFYT